MCIGLQQLRDRSRLTDGIAFHRRYMKYLYQYECEKVNLSTQDELQQAIDGNRREGRRSSYGHYAEMVGATPPPAGNRSNSHHTPPLALVSRTMNGHGMPGSSSGEEDNGNSLSSTPSHHNVSAALPAQQEALNLEVKAANNNNNINTSNGNSRVRDRDVLETRAAVELASRKLMEEALSAPPAKRFLPSDDERYLLTGGFPSAHIKISSRGQSARRPPPHPHPFPFSADGRSQMESSCLVVSMDINGVTYQGVLQAPSHRSRIT